MEKIDSQMICEGKILSKAVIDKDNVDLTCTENQNGNINGGDDSRGVVQGSDFVETGTWNDVGSRINDRDLELATQRSVTTLISMAIHQEDKQSSEKSNAEGSLMTSPSRWQQMYISQDWWSLWIGLISFIGAIIVVFATPLESDNRIRYLMPQPMPWSTNIFYAWDVYGIIGTIILLILMQFLYLSSLFFMGRLNDPKQDNSSSKCSWLRIMQYSKGFIGLCLIAVLAFWIGREQWCTQHGLGYAVWSILLGMVIGNCDFFTSSVGENNCLLLAAKDGEFFIKCSLVLLAVEFRVLGEVGLPAVAVAWIGSPLSLLAGYVIGSYVFNMDRNKSLLISTGATWCGASAMSAISSVIGSKPEDLSLCISLVAAATVVFTFLQAYIAMACGISDRVAGAWIGGSIDQTGNVVASASIISEEAMEVAGIVKMVLNSGLGILTSVVAFLWEIQQCQDKNTLTRSANNNEIESHKKGFNWLFLWDKFPKFILGYLICSAALSIILPQVKSLPEGKALPHAISTLNRWWFAVAFVGIGVSTNLKRLYQSARKSGVIQLYIVTNTIDILLSLGLAYMVF